MLKNIKLIDSDIASKIIDLNQIDLFESEYPNFKINSEEHYNNKVVMDRLQRLPPFDWRHTHYKDGLKRFYEGLVELEGNQKYEGEWI